MIARGRYAWRAASTTARGGMRSPQNHRSGAASASRSTGGKRFERLSSTQRIGRECVDSVQVDPQFGHVPSMLPR